MLLALDAHAAPLRCAADARVLIVGLGCSGGGGGDAPTAAALAAARAVRAGLPYAVLTLVDGGCSEAHGASAAAALNATWGGGGGASVRAEGSVFSVVALRGGAPAAEMLAAFVAYGGVLAPGGVLLAGGMESSYASGGDGNTHGTLAGLLQTVIDVNHCKLDRIGGCDRGGFGAPGERALLPRIKSVDCSAGVCAVTCYGDAELAHLNDGGAYVNANLRPLLAEFARSLPAMRAAPCTPLDDGSGSADETLWKLGLVGGTDKVYDPRAQGSTHQYHEPYTRHAGRRRCGIRNVLEIGLGCDMRECGVGQHRGGCVTPPRAACAPSLSSRTCSAPCGAYSVCNAALSFAPMRISNRLPTGCRF